LRLQPSFGGVCRGKYRGLIDPPAEVVRRGGEVARRLLSLFVWAVLLFLLWLVLVGTVASLELYAGAVAAAIGATAVELLRSRGLLRFPVELRWLARVWRPLAQIAPDFAFLALALFRTIVRRQLPADGYVAIALPGAAGEPRSPGWRALATAAGSLAPNSVVVDIDRERRLMLVHKLLPDRGPARPL
jgi:multisubunit Na+/H+ antiporter MnhE subunit